MSPLRRLSLGQWVGSSAIWLLPLLSGWLLTRSAPHQSLTPTVWVALVPLLLFLHRAATPGRAFLGAWLSGLVYFLFMVFPFTSLIWWGWAFTPEEYQESLRQQRLFLWIWYPLTSVWCAAWWGLWGAALVSLARSSRVCIWLAAGLWILLCEWVRSRVFFDFTWGYLGYALHPYETLSQVAALTGVTGLSALIVLVNAWVAHTLRSAWSLLRPRGSEPSAAPELSHPARELLVTLSVLIAAYGCWTTGARYARHPEPGQPEPVRIAALQASRRTYAREEFEAGALDWTYTPLIDAAIEAGAAVLVLPESVWLAKLKLDEAPFPETLSRHVTPEEIHDFLAPHLGGSGATILVGFDAGRQGELHNSMLAWDAGGMMGMYSKRRLTPFAEYPPGWFRHLAPKNRITYRAGRGAQLFAINGLRVGGFICQEAQFPHLARESVLAGAQLLVTTGNDGIFRHPAVAHGHQVAAQFRAIETHRPIARAMKTGFSSLIDAHGRVLKRSHLDQQAFLIEPLTPSDRTTPYTRWGDWPVALAALLILPACLARLAGKNRGTHTYFP